MNIRYKPASIQCINNPATEDTAFLWFNSKELDVGIVIDKNIIKQIIESLTELNNDNMAKGITFFGNIKVIED